jgi:hypothetical protein
MEKDLVVGRLYRVHREGHEVVTGKLLRVYGSREQGAADIEVDDHQIKSIHMRSVKFEAVP